MNHGKGVHYPRMSPRDQYKTSKNDPKNIGIGTLESPTMQVHIHPTREIQRDYTTRLGAHLFDEDFLDPNVHPYELDPRDTLHILC